MISKKTAEKIWNCHNEIEKANELIKEMKGIIEKHGTLIAPDHWGERRGIEMGIPSGDHSKRIFNVPPDVAIKAIESHIELQEAKLKELHGISSIELK